MSSALSVEIPRGNAHIANMSTVQEITTSFSVKSIGIQHCWTPRSKIIIIWIWNRTSVKLHKRIIVIFPRKNAIIWSETGQLFSIPIVETILASCQKMGLFSNVNEQKFPSIPVCLQFTCPVSMQMHSSPSQKRHNFESSVRQQSPPS